MLRASRLVLESRGGLQEALEKLQSMKKGGRAKWWQHLQPVSVKVHGEQKCFLKCTAGKGMCGKLMRVSATQQQQHLTT
jgi:cell fate regulator YaaT (PSP1 superfamily)